ncbi:MAG: hypothetical protein K1Y36_05355 [Blastocatellia bacterium]|nr:hypothetical protein [Blastocatellia bacterium]
MDNLKFIRETMESAAAFTAVPGWGGVAIGGTALAAAVIAGLTADPKSHLIVWLIEALVAIVIGIVTIFLKARACNVSLLSVPSRKFALSLSPPLLAGGILTVELFRAGLYEYFPGIWLLLYGTGIVTGGAYSVRIVPLMGIFFMAMGSVALFAPAAWGNWFLAAGFGFLHILFGIIIARKHGG